MIEPHRWTEYQRETMRSKGFVDYGDHSNLVRCLECGCMLDKQNSLVAHEDFHKRLKGIITSSRDEKLRKPRK